MTRWLHHEAKRYPREPCAAIALERLRGEVFVLDARSTANTARVRAQHEARRTLLVLFEGSAGHVGLPSTGTDGKVGLRRRALERCTRRCSAVVVGAQGLSRIASRDAAQRIELPFGAAL
jgi:hypothetical protein